MQGDADGREIALKMDSNRLEELTENAGRRT